MSEVRNAENSDAFRSVEKSCVEVSDPAILIDRPLVSVLMITYNHADYLAEAIEGVLAQKCNFPFELIIGEDASTDATLDVAIDYQKRYPHLIRVIHSRKNVGMNQNTLRILARARGKYVAYCEGDDFWCARDKLEKQVALIESDDQIGIVHTNWSRSRLHAGAWKYDLGKSVHRSVSARYLSGHVFQTWYFPKILRTCTVLIRREVVETFLKSALMEKTYLFGDSVLAAWVTSLWKVGYVPDVTAVYRLSPNSALRSGAKARVAFYRSALEFDSDARQFFAGHANYPAGYRWESAAGLFLWGIRARDFSAVKEAVRDLFSHFTFFKFVATGWRSVAMRLPSIFGR